MNDGLAERMKLYEGAEAGRRLMPLLPALARLDGRAFHTFVRGLAKPVDERLSDLMIDTATFLVRETHATVGYTQSDVDAGIIDARVLKLPLLRNPRAKMQGIRDGFVKLFCRPGTGIVVGGVVVSLRASELIHPISIAVDNNLTVEQMANTFTVYPSLSGSIGEAARQLATRKAAGEL